MIKEYGYEYDSALNEDLFKKTKGYVTNQMLFGAYCLRSGRDALKAIAREYSPRVVMLPAISCESMVRPFKLYGHKVLYYPLNEDYSINLQGFESIKGKMLFLYMNYFGRKAIDDADLKKLKKQHDVVIIEDRTHDYLCERESAFCPDYIIVSLRKWIPIPDGALLWGNISRPLACDTSFSETRLRAQCMRHVFLQSGDELLKKEYRAIFSSVSGIMDDDEPSAMSAYSYELAKRMNLSKIKTIRQSNAKELISVLKTSHNISLIQEHTGLSDLYVAFTLKQRDMIQRRLSEKGIFNTIIWPLSDEQRNICEIARFTEGNMLAAPCDQRYSTADMRFIGAEIVKEVEYVNQ